MQAFGEMEQKLMQLRGQMTCTFKTEFGLLNDPRGFIVMVRMFHIWVLLGIRRRVSVCSLCSTFICLTRGNRRTNTRPTQRGTCYGKKSLAYSKHDLQSRLLALRVSDPPAPWFFSQQRGCVGPSPPPFHWAASEPGPALCQTKTGFFHGRLEKSIHYFPTIIWDETWNCRCSPVGPWSRWPHHFFPTFPTKLKAVIHDMQAGRWKFFGKKTKQNKNSDLKRKPFTRFNIFDPNLFSAVMLLICNLFSVLASAAFYFLLFALFY